MAFCPDVLVYFCTNSMPPGGSLPRQWIQDGSRVLMHEIPCSGKIDGQYLFHALEGGARGLCVVTCPKGECHLAQGNYRAEIRARTLQRLLTEIGLEPDRVQLLHCSPQDPIERIESMVRDAVRRICALPKPVPTAVSETGDSPLPASSPSPPETLMTAGGLSPL